MIEKVLESINWAEGFYKGAFIVAMCALLYGLYHFGKYFGKRLIDSIENQHKLLNLLDHKTDLMIQDQKADRERFLAHEEYTNQRFLQQGQHIDLMLQSLIKVTKR